MIQSLKQFYTPGISLVIHLVEKARHGKKINLDLYSTDVLSIIEHAQNDYVIHIWHHLGDTNFNRKGYRQATDMLAKQLKISKQEKNNAYQ